MTSEAIRPTRQLREMVRRTPALGPQPEVDGLLALMLLTEARAAYDAAVGLAGNGAERAFLAGRRDRLG